MKYIYFFKMINIILVLFNSQKKNKNKITYLIFILYK